jgi:hypothetical protein
MATGTTILLMKLIPPVLGGIALLLTAILDYLHRDKRTNRFKRGRLWLFITLGLLLFTTPVSVYLDDHARDLAADRMNKRLTDLLTGGDTHVLAEVSPLQKSDGSVVGYNLYIVHSGSEAPVYDLRINIFNIHENDAMIFFEEVYRDEVPILTSQTDRLRLGDGSIYGFADFENIGVMVRQRNGTLRQIIKLLKTDKDYLVAEKAIFTTNDGRDRVVRESMPAEFKAAGRDQWHFDNFEMAKAGQPR